MEDLALTALKGAKEMKPEDFLASPLNDTLPVEDIISGVTIRRNKDNNDRIDLWKIERVYQTMVSASKTRIQNVVKYFEVEEIQSIV
jgi:hypothetical protein